MTYLYNKNVNPQNNNVVVSTTNPLPVTGNVNATIYNAANACTLVKFIDTDNPQLDTSSRLRVSTPQQQWWYVSSVDADTTLRYTANTSGNNTSVTFVQHLASTELCSGTDNNSSTIRASRRRHKVRPGVSHEYRTQINWDGNDTSNNVVKRAGMFTNYNGIFFEVSDDLYIVVRRRLIDGTLVERKISRNNFTYDTFNGSGPTNIDLTTNTTQGLTSYVSTSNVGIRVQNGTQANTNVYNVVFATSNNLNSIYAAGQKVFVSGMSPISYNGIAMISSIDGGNNRITLTYTKDPGTFSSMTSGKLNHNGFMDQYTLFFDFNGGRSTRVRFGLDSLYGPIVFHIEDFTGDIGGPYESAPALMERVEIVNRGAVNYKPTVITSGVTYNVEAAVDLNPGFSTAYYNTGVVFNKNATEEFPIMAIGLREGEPYQRADLQFQGLQLTDIGNINQQNAGVFFYRLLLNPTIGGTGYPAYTNIGKTSRQWNFANTSTVSGGTELLSGYMQSTTASDIRAALNFLNMGSNIEYTDADKVVLVVKQLVGGTDNGKIVALINFVEDL